MKILPKIILLPIALIALTACNSMEEKTRDFRYNIDKSYDNFRYRMSDTLYDRNDTAPDPEPPKPYYKASYCYRLSSDILCYRQPQNHLKTRFIGMQGDDGSYYADTPIYDNYGNSSQSIQTTSTQPKKKTKKKRPIDKEAPIELMPAF